MFAKDIIFSYVYDLQCHNIFFTSSFQLCSRIVGWISSKEQVAPALQPTQEPSRCEVWLGTRWELFLCYQSRVRAVTLQFSLSLPDFFQTTKSHSTMTLSSNNNKRPAAKATNNSDQQREAWPCLIYRLQSTRGWEVYCPSVGENGSGASSSSIKKAQPSSGKKSSQQTTMEEELTVCPRNGSIEVRKMRLRVRLFAQSQPGDGKSVNPNDEEQNEEDENNSDFVGADGWNNNALVVRRKDSLLVTTRRGMGALMFRFKSVTHCMEFCDRLVYLNQEYFMPSSSSSANANHSASIINQQNESSMSGMDQRELYVDEMRSNKRRKADTIGDQHNWNSSAFRGAASSSAERNENDDVARSEEEEYHDVSAMQYRRKDELLSYIVKLSQDDDFMGFVDEISRGLEAAGDNAGIYRSL